MTMTIEAIDKNFYWTFSSLMCYFELRVKEEEIRAIVDRFLPSDINISLKYLVRHYYSIKAKLKYKEICSVSRL